MSIKQHTPWRDKETLEYLYWDKEMSNEAVADRLNCAASTVHRWKNHHDISSRNSHNPPTKGGEGLDEFQSCSKADLYELMWEKQLTSGEIAERFDISSSTVHRHYHKHGIPMAGNYSVNAWVFRMLSRELLYELYWGKGMTHAQIAEQYDVSEQLVCRVYNERNIPQEPHRPPEFSGDELPRGYEWPDGAPSESAQQLPEDPDGSKYLADFTTMDKDELYKLHWEYGCSVEHIASMSDLSERAVRDRMESSDVPLRIWRSHTDWEPHHGVPPKYEWPDDHGPDEDASADEYNAMLWRSPEGAT